MRWRANKLAALAALAVAPICAPVSHAIIVLGGSGNNFYSSNPDPNNLGQYEGDLGDFVGTPVAPRYFLTAAHIGTPGGGFTYNNGTGTATNYSCQQVATDDDLALWELTTPLTQSFTLYAPIYTNSNETGQPAYMFGRGTLRGSAIDDNSNNLHGWNWGAYQSALTWGDNTIAGAGYLSGYGNLLATNFQASSDPNLGILSDHDSGGGMFVQDPTDGVWKLAGINYLVGEVSATSGGPGLQAAIFDPTGFYSGSTLITSANASENLCGSYDTRVSSYLGFLLEDAGATFTPNGSGLWINNANWNDNAAPSVHAAPGSFTGDYTDSATLTGTGAVDLAGSAINLGSLTFSSGAYNIIDSVGGGGLIFNGSPSITVTAGNHAIQTSVILNADTNVTVTHSGDSLAISGPVTGNHNLILNGAGTLNLTGGGSVSQLSGNGNLALGSNGSSITTLQIASAASPGAVANTLGSLTINANGQLDITNNSLSITGAALSTIQNYVASGYNGGSWTGSGIVSSLAAGNPNGAVGYIDNGGTITVRYTVPGDATCSGSVGYDDLVILAQHYDTTGNNWSTGDFNYDPTGAVGFADLVILAQHYDQTLSDSEQQFLGSTFAADWSLALNEAAAVPEPGPASLALLGLGMASLLGSRRRCHAGRH